MITTEDEVIGNVHVGAIAVFYGLFVQNLLDEIGRVDDDRGGRPNLERENGPVFFGPFGEPVGELTTGPKGSLCMKSNSGRLEAYLR
jgi:hypothetical protein